MSHEREKMQNKTKKMVDYTILVMYVLSIIVKVPSVTMLVNIYAIIFGVKELVRKTGKTDKTQKGKLRYFILFPIVFGIQLFLFSYYALTFPIEWERYCSITEGSSSNNIYYLIVDLIILGPIKEEYLFRVIPEETNNRLLYYLMAVVLFSYIHCPQIPTITLLRIPISFLYALSYEKTKKEWVPIVLHCLNNISCLLLAA